MDIPTQEIQNLAAEEKQEVSIGSDRKRKGTGSKPPYKRRKLSENVNMAIDRSDVEWETEEDTDIDCISDGDIMQRNGYHRDELLPSQREREANLLELSAMTEDSEMEQNRIDRMNHNHNNTRVQQEETDYTDEEFAIMEARRRTRRPCTDYIQYLLR